MQSSSTIIALDIDGHDACTTPDHPFFTANGWVSAGDLKAGDEVRTAEGTWATIKAIAVEGPQPVPGFAPYPSSWLLLAST